MNPKYVKEQYKHSFKNRRTILEEDSLRSRLYDIRYTTVANIINEFVNNNTLIVDAGCGDGVFISKIIDKYPRIIGLDLSIKSLSYIRNNLDQIKYIPLIQSDIEHLPFPPNKITAIVSIETIEHLENIKNGLKEIYQALKPNGIIIATVPSAINPRNLSIVGKQKINLIPFIQGLAKALPSVFKGYVEHNWKDEQGYQFPHKVYYKWKIGRIIKDCGFKVKVIGKTPLVISSKSNTIINKILRTFEKIINKISGNCLGELIVICAAKE